MADVLLEALLQGDSALTGSVTRERLLQALLQGDSALTAEVSTAVVTLVLKYLLSVVDQIDCKLSVEDRADFKLKVADLLNYVARMGD